LDNVDHKNGLVNNNIIKGKSEGKGHPRTGHGSPKGE